MKSIQRRLSWSLAGALLAAGLLLAHSGLLLFDHSLRNYLKSDLKNATQNLLAAIIRADNGLQLDTQRLDPRYLRPLSGQYFQIQLDDRQWRSRSLWDSPLQQPPQPGLQDGLGSGPGQQQLLIYRADYQRFGQQLRITVAQDYTPILDAFRRLQWLALGLGGLSLLLILLALRYTVRSALRPLEQARQQIAQLQQGQRSTLDSRVPVELEPLVQQINHLLAHTEDNLRRSRTALGNLGHALKTPLAVLFNLSHQLDPQCRSAFDEQLQQIRQRLERELGRARLGGDALPGAHFDCAAELPGLFDTLRMVHARSLQLEWQAPPDLRLPKDREDLLELLGNLLDNACKWAQQRVQLDISAQADGYRLLIDDDGPGIDPARREQVISRGSRLDQQVAGHGLGLGIVRDIVDAWQGRLTLADSPLGGLRVDVWLPARR